MVAYSWEWWLWLTKIKPKYAALFKSTHPQDFVIAHHQQRFNYDGNIYSTASYVAMTLQESAPELALALEPSVTLWKDPTSPIAEEATRRSPRDWNQFLKEMPKVFLDDDTSSRTWLVGGSIQYLLAIIDDTAWFLGEYEYLGKNYAIYKTTYHSDTWTLYYRGKLRHYSYGTLWPPGGEDDWDRHCWRCCDLKYDKQAMKFRFSGDSFNAHRSAADMEPVE